MTIILSFPGMLLNFREGISEKESLTHPYLFLKKKKKRICIDIVEMSTDVILK